MKFRYWLVASMVLLAGCGKQERTEAVGFYKVLAEKRAIFTESNTIEVNFVSGAKEWCESIITKGAGKGDQLKQEADAVRDLAKSAGAISTQVGLVRQAIYDQSIHEEFPQSVRTTLIGQLTKRQRFLQDLRTVLADTATGFEDLAKDKAFKGDSYPMAVDKLRMTLSGYRPPTDAVGEAVTALSTKYSIKDADLGTT